MKISQELLKTVFNVLVFVVLPLIVFTLITSKVSLIANLRSFVVLTGSMQPLIPAGAVVFSQKKPSYSQNDIITFETNGITVTHRVVEVITKDGNTFFKTKGDANNASDSDLVAQSAVIGEALFHFPYLGKLIVSLKSLPGFFALIVLPTALFILMELKNIKREIEKEVEKKLLQRLNTDG